MADSMPYEQSRLYKIRHSLSHIMAQAVKESFPEARLGIGPPIKDGFYYDIELSRGLTPEDLDRIELRMKEIVRTPVKFTSVSLSSDEARSMFKDEPYKRELIEDILLRRTDEYGNALPDGQSPALTAYTHAGPDMSFTDLCRGPHVAGSNEIDPDALKIMSVAAAYWRGDSKRPMLQRIYGTAWENRKDLEDHLARLEEAKKRDHRTLGKELDLFSTSPEVGPGLILWHPKGAMVRYLAERFSQQAHLSNGYQWAVTPHIGRAQLFKDAMYPPLKIEGEDFYLKPMSCPFHIQIFKSRQRSYRELPLRLAEFATVYRYELSGVLQGLTRVRGFTQDDAHTFCLPEQAEQEIRHAVRFSLYVLRSFGLVDFKAYIATRPPGKAIGTQEEWDKAIERLRLAIELEGLPYEYDEGGGAFYGPKVDIKVNDCLGREWQLSTVQFDFNLPRRFGMTYIGSDNKPAEPVMIHRALFGSVERFFGLLIEHYGGAFPLWLAPLQVVIIPVTDSHASYAHIVAAALMAEGFRAEVDEGQDRMGAKIRNAQLAKIPYALIVGKDEILSNTVSVRNRERGDLGKMPVTDFIERTREERMKGVAKALDRRL
jgi:threonyl-tRNA synthetase